MKLCIIVSNSLKKDPRVIKQVKVAVENGIETHFLGYRDMHYDESFLQSLGCHVYIVDLGEQYVGQLSSTTNKIKRKLLMPCKMIKALRRIKPDIIHANDFDMLPLAFVGGHRKRTKIIYDTHEIFAENLDMQNKKHWKKIVIRAERFLIKRVYAVISVSHAAAEYLGKKYNIPMPTVVTNCPFMYKGTVLKKNAGDFEVLYHGLMTRGRGYEELIKAGEFVRDHVKIVLRGYGSQLETLKKLAEENPRGNVLFEGPVEVSELVYFASRSDVGVVLTQPINVNFELTVSNKVFEYTQAGLPVIMSDLPEHRYLNARFDFGIIVDQSNPVAIAEAVNRLAADTALYGKLKKNAGLMATELCWENESKKLLELYAKGGKNC